MKYLSGITLFFMTLWIVISLLQTLTPGVPLTSKAIIWLATGVIITTRIQIDMK